MQLSQLLPFLALLSVGVVATRAALPPQLYWQSVLPSTPIPSSISHLLPSSTDWKEDKGTSVAVGKGGVHVDAAKGKPGGTNVNVGKGGVNVDAGKGKPGGTNVNVGKGGVNVDAGRGKPGGGTTVNVGGKGGGVNVNTPHKGKPVHVAVGKSPFVYNYAATETQLHDDPNVALFFMEKDLKAGHKMNLHFTRSSDQASFLPREQANSIPFSSAKFGDILNRFDIKPESEDAQLMKNTLTECEEAGIKGEEKYCATSLESMVDFTTSKLGNKVDAVSTEAVKDTRMQEYTIAPGVKKVGENEAVACHRQEYPYAVFYCHKSETTRAYRVPLEGADGVRVKAVAVCHTDTSQWNPKHLAFQVLKVEPGTVPVCHFLPQDHLVWVPRHS
ncbi:BURP domain protein RD22 [Neltuma alba]|uniref:BURP domain protein RD22 n=1 Tax=Neltuma alba TaxID=207710 RepID=UPI0010A440C9|nr:BURP domain protein RD22-like [Prosopis alba]